MVCNTLLNIDLEDFTSKSITLPAVPARYIEVSVDSNENEEDEKEVVAEHKALPFARTELMRLPIKSARTLCDRRDAKKVMEINFDIKENRFDFLPGDTIGILPQNRDEDVKFLIESLDLHSNANRPCRISVMKATQKKGAKVPMYLPSVTTIRAILRDYLNIYCIPKKLLIRTLVEFTSDDKEQLTLQILCSKEGAAVYNRCIVDGGLRFIDLLRICPSCKPPLGTLIEHLPRLLPRAYSIANSPLKTADDIRIVISILHEPRKGLTTKILEKATESITPITLPHVNLYLRDRNSFVYTENDLDWNIVMISIGCGISPFLGFMEHKCELMKKATISKTEHRTLLFSGSRYRSNAIYRERFEEFMKLGVIDQYFESFSREPDAEFKYVQDQIVANANSFVQLILSSDTKVFVCADGKNISNDIATTVVDCLKNVCQMTQDEANEMLKDMRKNCRYVEDIWL